MTQMNHIPKDVDYDTKKQWVELQLESTLNVHPSTFNDWFTGLCPHASCCRGGGTQEAEGEGQGGAGRQTR